MAFNQEGHQAKTPGRLEYVEPSTDAIPIIFYSSLILPFCFGLLFLDILHLIQQTIAVGVKMIIKTIVVIIPNTVNSVEALPFPPCVFLFFAETLAAVSFLSSKGTSIYLGIEVEAIPRYNEDSCGMMLGVDSTLVEERFSTTSGTLIDPGISADKTLISFECSGFMFGVGDTAVLVEVLVCEMLGVGSTDKVVAVNVAGVVSLQSVLWPSKKYPLGHLRPHLRFWSGVHS